jgi:hypothetical protein
MKLTSDNIKKITRGGSAIYIICFAAFAVFDFAIRPNVANEWAEPLVQSLLFLIAGTIFVTLTSITGIAAWKMTEDEYYEMLVSQAFWGKKWLSRRSKTYWHWQNRILVFPGVLMGLFISIIGFIGLVTILIRII